MSNTLATPFKAHFRAIEKPASETISSPKSAIDFRAWPRPGSLLFQAG
jgi:hypothetical protein